MNTAVLACPGAPQKTPLRNETLSVFEHMDGEQKYQNRKNAGRGTHWDPGHSVTAPPQGGEMHHGRQ